MRKIQTELFCSGSIYIKLGEFQIDGDIWWCIAAVIFLFFEGWLNAAQTAAVAMADFRIKKLAEDGDRKAAALSKLLEGPDGFLAKIETGRIFCSAAFGGCTLVFLNSLLLPLMKNVKGAGLISAAAALLVICFLHLTFGVWFSKKLGGHFCERLALRSVSGLRFAAAVFTPLSWLCRSLGSLLAKPFGAVCGDEERVTEEEIRMMVDVGQEKGVIEDSEKNMINHVFEFDDRSAAEVMTHRTEVCAVEDTEKIQTVMKTAISEGYSRLPVYHEDIDRIIGVIYVKDLLKYAGRQFPEKLSASDVMRKPYFVPESISCRELFVELTSRGSQFAVVVDEYGGTAGIVTIEDLIESIVGNIRDEYDDEEEEFVKTGEDTYTADGSMSLSELEELMDTELPEGEYDTVGGMILAQLGHIPTEEERAQVQAGDLRFTVEKVDNLRISKVTITRLPRPEQDGDGEE